MSFQVIITLDSQEALHNLMSGLAHMLNDGSGRISLVLDRVDGDFSTETITFEPLVTIPESKLERIRKSQAKARAYRAERDERNAHREAYMAKRALQERAVTQFQCPKCGRERWQPCVSMQGNNTTPHVARVRLVMDDAS